MTYGQSIICGRFSLDVHMLMSLLNFTPAVGGGDALPWMLTKLSESAASLSDPRSPYTIPGCNGPDLRALFISMLTISPG